ncbi:HlyD family efflux transporter periplasmic adaptor subunit [Carboxydocella sp. JDF658]|uniref:HlyD family efflux transporter periplasmic adaptor subunit n=1 Tax=Carboxydocella sp. JDF658 TaxID=1926600 RepID=UPI0009AE8BB6|nr:HlyD family efflux transporter periplasmic adaptor subunit [Carboxydocella sp. JDF658]GAW31088.1 hypothetical protein JDF658_08530 [Carboxydocella sp. JDF658]
MKKGKLALIIGISLLVVAGAAWGWLGRSKTTTTSQPASIAVRKGELKVTISGNGTIQPAVSKSITTAVSGKISSINFQNGQQVKAGDLLFTITADSLAYDLARSRLELKQAELELANLKTQQRQLQITAPVSGYVTGVQVSTGQEIQKGMTLLTIEDRSKLKTKISFNEAQINQIKVGQKAEVTVTDLFTTLTGTVTEVDRNGRADSNGAKLYDVTVEITNPGSLSPGMKTQVTVQTAAGTETGLSAGTLAWADTTTVRALTGGTVTKLLVDENSYVRKGQLLVSLSNDSLVSQIASQELRVEQARLALAQVEQQQAETKIYAPWDGIVYLSQASSTISGSSSNSSATTSASNNGSGNLQVGDEVKSGQILATLLSPSLQVVVPVDETDIGKIYTGQKAEITVDAYPERKFAGTVTEIAAQGTVQNKVASFDVTLVLDDTTGLKAGMTANVEILVEDKKDALMLPIEAIIERGDRKFVRTEAGSLQAVETGLYNETMIEIKSGLKEGDRVVLPEVVRKNNSNQQPRFPGAGGPPGGMR